jgi:penicillin-binding protein 1A
MSVVHADMNIPTIPGLQPHPVQVAEQQRLAALRPQNGGADGNDPSSRATTSLMSDQTRDTLKRLARELRKAGGISEPAVEETPDLPGQAPPPDKRAGGSPLLNLQENRTYGAAQPNVYGSSRRALP